MANLKFKIKNSKPQFKIKNFKFLIIIFHFSFFIFSFCGCATIKETAKGIAGVSTKALEEGRKEAITKTFAYDYFSCYAKTWDILKRINAYPYAYGLDKNMIAIYISEEDTTPVGLFFKEIDDSHTQIEVSSQSLYAKELISKKVFLALEKSFTGETEKEKD